MKSLSFVALLALAACGSIGSPPTQVDPKVLDRVAKVCMSSGLFKIADGTLSTFVPAAALPIALVNAGVDRVCADPAKFAADATTAEWLVKQIGKAPK